MDRWIDTLPPISPVKSKNFDQVEDETPPVAEPVFLNVYDIQAVKGWNDFLFGIGQGAFHSGLEVYGTEYCFGNWSGIGEIPPRTAEDGPLRCTIELGKCRLHPHEVKEVIESLRLEFPAAAYNIVSYNCHHFCEAMSKALVGCGLPGWVNRTAGLGNFLGLGDWAKRTAEAMVLEQEKEEEEAEARRIDRLLTNVERAETASRLEVVTATPRFMPQRTLLFGRGEHRSDELRDDAGEFERDLGTHEALVGRVALLDGTDGESWKALACDEPEPGFFALLASEVAADFGIGDELHGSGDAFEAVRAQLGEDMLKQVQHAFTKRAGHAAIANSERRLELKYGVECLTCKRSQLAEQDPDWKERMRQEYLTTSGGW